MSTDLTSLNNHMNNYCLPLNLDFPLFNSNLSSIDFLKSQPIWADNVNSNPAVAKHFRIDYDLLSNEMKQFFHSHDQKINLCEIF